jgi:hypothetical protein
MDWSSLDNKGLLQAYCSLMTELRQRGVTRSSNNPVADYTEALVAKTLGLTLGSQSQAGYDACDSNGLRYQIKGRRLTAQNSSTQLSALRNLGEKPFDILAAVMYSEDLSIAYGALVPVEVVIDLGRYSQHSNSHIFMFRKSVLEHSQVTDITAALRSI